MNNKFNVGDQVNAIAFTDCFGKPVAEVVGLTVTDVNEIARMGQPPYYRVKAVKEGRISYVEGAERFFESAAVQA